MGGEINVLIRVSRTHYQFVGHFLFLFMAVSVIMIGYGPSVNSEPLKGLTKLSPSTLD